MKLSPSAWPAADRERWVDLEKKQIPGNPVARGYQGIVTTSHHSLATRIGLEVLAQGGSAIDAVTATSLAQIALGAGGVISYFGISGLVYFDADEQEVTTLHAPWKGCAGELAPHTIPSSLDMTVQESHLLVGGTPSGRGAMVGGYMRALEAAHKRYGKLPFAKLFEPAIELAEQGFEVGEELDFYINIRGDDLRRLPDTAAIFVKADGSLFRKGDWFRQPALAKTLRAIADNGADYLYTGAWAERCCAAVQREGGTMTVDDLASYQPQWAPPLTLNSDGYELALIGAPSAGGSVNLVEAINLAKVAGIKDQGHWSKSPKSFRDMAVILTANLVGEIPKQFMPPPFQALDLSREARVTREHAEKLWPLLNSSGWMLHPQRSTCSDDVVAADQWGNIAALCHTSNCMFWGKTALIVDGITIHDPAMFQQAGLAAAGPGGYVKSPLEVGLILKNGVAEIGFASKNMGLHQKTVGTVTSILEFGMTLEDADRAPEFCMSRMDASNPAPATRVVEGDYTLEFLAATGLKVDVLSKDDAWLGEGHCIGVSRNPASGLLTAVSPRGASGQAAVLKPGS